MDVMSLNMTSFEKMCKKKCAEVFYQNIENFSIVCTQCNLEAIKFDDFLLHFKEMHVHCNEPVTIKSEKDVEGDTIFRQQDAGVNSTLYEDPIELNCSREIAVETLRDLDANIKSEDESLDHDRLELSSNSEEDDKPLKLLRMRTRKKRTKGDEISTEITDHTCDECGKVYKSRKTLCRHIRNKHSTSPTNSEAFHCSSCTKIYVTKSALRAHERMKHQQTKDGTKPGTYPCTKCDKVYTDKYSLKDHLLRHAGQKNFSCDVPGCTRTFFNRKNLNFHVRNMHVGEKNYVCEICGHSTKAASSLVMHKRTHTGEKPFNCPTCGKAFASMSGVREHQVTHNAPNERPHVCNVCGKTFARRKALYHHMPLHSDVKKFICKICGKAYSQLAGLSAHKRQHLLNNFGEETQNKFWHMASV